MEKNKNRQLFEKTLDVFAWLCLLLAVILSVIAVFAAFSGENNGKEIFGRKILIVNTGSMSKSAISENEEIFFNPGDVIVIKVIEDITKLKEGDVISFFSYNPESMGMTVSHKIREIKYSDSGEITGFITYGINKGTNDMVEVKPEHLMGRYSFKVPKVGHLFAFLKTPRGFYLSILIPGVLLIIFFSVKVGKVLGKQEYAKLYNDEVEGLKSRLTTLEGKGGLIQSMEQTMNQNIEQQNTMQQPTEQTQQSANQSQTGSVVYQTITINYPPMPFMSQPVISQTAPSGSSPVYQTITLSPMPNIPTPPAYQPMPYIPQPVMYQPAKENQPQTPVPMVSQVASNEQGKTVSQSISGVMPQFAYVPMSYQPMPFQPQPMTQPITQPAPQQTVTNTQPASEQMAITKDVVKQEDEEVSNNKLSIPEGKKRPFLEKLADSKKETQEYFNRIHNELASYKKVSSRTSFRCVSYRKGRTLLAKISLRGKTLRAYFNLDVNAFNKNVYFQNDMSSVKAYEEVPFAVKIKSERACNNATKLVNAVAEKFELTKNDKFEKVEILKEQNK